jgi:DNA-binding ferritin-like protein
VSPAVKALRNKATEAYERLDFKDLTRQELAARAQEDVELKERGIASLYSPVKVKNLMSGKGTRRNTTTGGDLVTSLLTLRNQVKLYHWQTKSFARHTATDALTTALDASIDAFVESYMGRYGRPKVSGSIKLHNFSESAARTFVAQQTAYLTKVLPKKVKSTDTDLLNLRDEILGELNKVLYLFTLA